MSDGIHDEAAPGTPWTSEASSSASSTSAATEPDAFPPGSSAQERVAFCQDCGRPLTQDTVRNVGAAVFCEPCLATRVGARPSPYAQDPALVAGMTHPGFAALLGFIPGVGAMYNGQVAKGFLHLGIFAALVWMADHVTGLFAFFVLGWVAYQVFDAYHTAKAREIGAPLPNLFGLTELGDRISAGTRTGTAYGTSPRPPAAPGPPGPSATAPATAPGEPSASTAPPPPYAPLVPPTAGPGWVGYVPPSAFAQRAAPPAWTQPAYVPPGASAAYTPVVTAPAADPAFALPTARRFPVGALWLIGLGVLILLANFVPDWRLSGRWLVPVLLAGLSAWVFSRRLHSGDPLPEVVRWPLLLFTLAVLFALQAWEVASLGRTWPVLVIVVGLLLLVERTLTPADPPDIAPPFPGAAAAQPPSADPTSAEAEAARSRAAWTTGSPTDPGAQGGA